MTSLVDKVNVVKVTALVVVVNVVKEKGLLVVINVVKITSLLGVVKMIKMTGVVAKVKVVKITGLVVVERRGLTFFFDPCSCQLVSVASKNFSICLNIVADRSGFLDHFSI